MKSVIVTGCGKGLGFATAKLLAENGYQVIGISRSETKEYQSLILNFPDSVFFINMIFQMLKVYQS